MCKGIEAYFTVLIETTGSRKRSLEIVLTFAEVGPGIYGTGIASERFFSKHALARALSAGRAPYHRKFDEFSEHPVPPAGAKIIKHVA